MIPKFETNYNSLMLRHFDSLGVLSDVIPDLNFKIFKKNLELNKPEHENMYWYHKDHLGSSTQISDRDANIIHHLEYMHFDKLNVPPSGEQFSEQRDSWSTPYKFNDYGGESFNKAFDEHTARSAELDAETGLYYYGARYYTPEIGIWLSVDPLSDKYPSLSPYAYCALNPVMLVDPDGREIWTTSEGWAVMENAFNSTLGEKNNPFTFNSETGKVEFDGNKKIGKLNDKQQEIVDRYKSLADDKSFKVDVNVVDNDQKLDLGNGEMKSLKDNGWNGAAVPSADGKQTSVYISKEPFYKDPANGNFSKNPQTEDMQGIISIHEIGGHAYGYQQKIFGNQNNNQTEIFEGRVRSIYESKYIKNYIKNQPVMKHY